MAQTLQQIRDLLAADLSLGDPVSQRALAARLDTVEGSLLGKAGVDAAGINVDIKRLAGLAPLGPEQGGSGRTDFSGAVRDVPLASSPNAFAAPTILGRASDAIYAREFLLTDGSQTPQVNINALATAAMALTPDKPIYIDVPRGYYRPAGSCIIRRTGSVILECNGQMDATGLSRTSSQALFSFTPPLASVIPDFQTSVTDAIGPEVAFIPVANAAGFVAGGTVFICSSEYHSGVAGQSGYAVKTKGEMAVLKWVDYANNRLYPEGPLLDTYVLSRGSESFTIKITQRPMMGRVVVRGAGDWIGTGFGTESVEEDSFRALRIERSIAPKIEGGDFRSHSRFGAHFLFCLDPVVTGTHHYGRDQRIASNNGIDQSPWFTSVYFASCQGLVFSVNNGRGLRRMFDADSVSVDEIGGCIIGRGANVTGNIAEYCGSAFGCHTMDDVLYATNQSFACGGMFSRGKNVAFRGNTLRGVLGNAFRAGAVQNSSVSPYPSVGRVSCTDNEVWGADKLLEIGGNTDDVDVSDNRARRLRQDGVTLMGQAHGSVSLTGGLFDFVDNGWQSAGLHIMNGADKLAALGAVKVEAVEMRGHHTGVCVEGVNNPAAAARMSVTVGRCTFAAGANVDANACDVRLSGILRNSASGGNGNTGWFGDRMDVNVNLWSFELPGTWEPVRYTGSQHRYRAAPRTAAMGTTRAPYAVSHIGSALPGSAQAGRTYRVGDLAWLDGAVNRCTRAGTAGSFSKANCSVSGSTLTLSSPGTVGPGAILVLPGAGPSNADLVTEAVNLTADGTGALVIITLRDAASQPVASLTVSVQAPLWQAVNG